MMSGLVRRDGVGERVGGLEVDDWVRVEGGLESERGLRRAVSSRMW